MANDTVGFDTELGQGKKILFYVQHLLGIGHLVRASRIARALHEAGFDVTMVTGGTAVQGFPPEGVRHVQLPPVVASNSGFSSLAEPDGTPVGPTFEDHRRDLLLKTYDDIAPDVVIIEAFPFGRRQVRFELLPLLAAIKKTCPKPLLFSSVRDILQENRKPGRDDETITLIHEHFDGVLVHGDPAFVALEETFPRAREFADKILYTGLVTPPPAKPSADRYDIVVSAGGGAVGAGLITAALAARQILDDGRSWCVITGPNLPQSDFDHFFATAPTGVTVTRFRTDLPSLLMNAQISVSQAGYNTVCDLLQTNCRPIFIPFAAGGETEQSVRAGKLAAAGLAEVIDEATLDVDVMVQAIRRATARTPVKNDARANKPPALALDGASKTVSIVDGWLRLN